MVKRKHIKPLPILDYSGFIPKTGSVKVVKKHHYFIITDISITGDAPKDFISLYNYGTGRKANIRTWHRYIAKHGHKHYPCEAITEHLLNRIGTVLGFEMAESELALLGGQIRFLSKYFLTNQEVQQLYHGADLYAGYLNDREFVEEIEFLHKSPDFFTVQFTEEVLKHLYPQNWQNLMIDFVKLLFLDAIIGNNDRHFYNWGIIKNLENKAEPRFSPIYDTARGLFWNDHEDKIRNILNNKARLQSYIRKYSEGSSPKIGWEGDEKINHFKLVEKLCTLEITNNCDTLTNIFSNNKISDVFTIIDDEFHSLMTPERIDLIKQTLNYRFEIIKKTFTFAQ